MSQKYYSREWKESAKNNEGTEIFEDIEEEKPKEEQEVEIKQRHHND